ncbi:MAG TPA: ribose 5-phosphate isomerase B [Firmicutes bacterium]|jgi:ribose 5-phosphate isomerase B|nr:MAG: ribose 5-phosphate isomerase [Peptococcaceae bacterium 1109]HHT73746.1 ribose 5-phosphate isomerase B [Bacillota bacterium]
MRIALGSDHVGIELKVYIKEYLEGKDIECVDVGCYSTDRVHYPDYAKKVGEEVTSGRCDLGMLFCGTGVGMSIAANKVKGIRCVVCSEPYSAQLSREHNNTNVLAIGSRVVGQELAKMIVDAWLNAEYEGGRHGIRVDMITEMEG